MLSIQDHLLAVRDTAVMTVAQVWLAGCLVGAGALIWLQMFLLKAYNGKFTTPIQPKAARFRRTELILYLGISDPRPMGPLPHGEGAESDVDGYIFNTGFPIH